MERHMGHRFLALESWRGITACLVALFHLDAYSHVYDVPFLRNSWLFVDFFFVLSGFIIAATYQKRLNEGYGLGRFLLLRLGRLYPLHLAMLALFIVFALLKLLGRALLAGSVSPNAVMPFTTPAEAPSAIFANLLLVQSLHLFDCLTWNVPSWSISTEFFTYVIFAACVIALGKRARVALPVALIGGPVLIAMLSERNMSTNYDWGIIRCVYGFAAGVMAWHLYRSGDRFKKFLSVRSIGSVVEWAALGMAVVFVSVADTTNPLSIAAPYVFALVVLVFAFEAGSASSMLRWWPLVFLGTVSYSIYMTHVFVEQRLFDVAGVFGKVSHLDPFTHRDIAGQDIYFLGIQQWQGDLVYPVYLTLVIVMSCFTYFWIEKPAREWVRNRVQGRPQAMPVTQLP
jgi:peptidoglycan/LPS O-acetylase OafA/YrhL